MPPPTRRAGGGLSCGMHFLTRDVPPWRTLEITPRWSNAWVSATTHRVATPTRPEGVEWTVVHRKAAVVIAPFLADGRALLVRQERIPVRASLWEFPAGQIELPDEGRPDAEDEALLLATAARELREEAGHALAPGGRWERLGYFFTSAAFTDEHSHLVAATLVEPHAEGHAPEADEAITECRAFTPEELRTMIAAGEIRDANSLAMFARLTASGWPR